MEHRDVKEENQGRFNQQLLQDIWTEKGFSTAEQGKLLNLMLKDGLEVCFRATENGEEMYIAPQLLPKEAPADACWQDSPENLRYVYQYPFMPKGIIGRLIVRLHEYIENCEGTSCVCGDREWSRKMVWKNGIYLRKDHCLSRVRFINDRKLGREIIKIEVQGKEVDDRKHVLREIRQELYSIHRRSFPSLKFFEKIPCNCEECKGSTTPNEHDNAKLDRMKGKGIGKVQCDVSGEMISIRQLQDGVFGQHLEPVPPPDPKPTPQIDEKNWWIRWWKWIVAAVGFIGSLASIISLL
ncbi:MAG: hypothetical protein D3903_06230 [Candidatus Electrothrix sp. GM3_4]|nr:hypothetical protein [Candidatus Electrothrix sp. GM3_4]